MTESFTTADGRRLCYRVLGGDGPTLVCHPGGPGFSSRYFADLAGLGEHVRLVFLDPRGTGPSDRPADPRAYDTDDYVSDVEELREHLGLDELNLYGHSHGGVVAQAYAARHPARVRRLILASTLARFQDVQVAAMEEAMQAKSGESWYTDAATALEAEQAGEFDSDEELGALVFRELPFYFARFGDVERSYLSTLEGEHVNGDALRLFNTEVFTTFDLREELGRVTAPTLVITGSEDFITGPLCARELVDGIADVRYVVLEGCGHFVHVEAAEPFRTEILDFLGAAA